jgi:hypothetical protein
LASEFDRLGPKDFIIGCLAVVVALIVVPMLVIVFKVSIYLAIIVGIILAVILGTALLGKVIRLIFFKSRSDDQQENR